ncbi:MAG: S-adenosylmethionine:tRNA ribosyltransferase-isomerase, partial [Duncaniella sp.]|nr:S-adenosylmethionine:tRNA ribosyltransferase-isomerase [Duncaniella sp.]
MIEDIRIDDFDYPLPDARIAVHPLEERDSCLLLVKDEEDELSTKRFTDLP